MKKYLSKIKIIIIALVLTIGINWASAAYTAKPSCTPTGCNTPSMINSGSTHQARVGGMALGTSGTGEGILFVNGVASADSMVVSNMLIVTGNLMANHLYFTPDAFNPNATSNELCIMTTTKEVVKCN